MDSVRNFHPGGLDPYPTSDTPSAAARAIHTLDCEEPANPPGGIPLVDSARAVGVRSNAATNKAKRQTIPAFRVRNRWIIAPDYR